MYSLLPCAHSAVPNDQATIKEFGQTGWCTVFETLALAEATSFLAEGASGLLRYPGGVAGGGGGKTSGSAFSLCSSA